MSDKRNIKWSDSREIEGDYYIQNNTFYPIDKYDDDSKFRYVCKAADKYHFLLVPLMVQWCDKKDKKGDTPAQVWCGRTSYSMVYNWHILVNDSSPIEKYKVAIYGENNDGSRDRDNNAA